MAVDTYYILLDHLLVLILNFYGYKSVFKSCQVIQVKMSSTDTKYINNMNQCKNMLGYLSNDI